MFNACDYFLFLVEEGFLGVCFKAYMGMQEVAAIYQGESFFSLILS